MGVFETKVDLYRTDAAKLFQDAQDTVDHGLGSPIPDLPPPLAPPEQKKLDAAKAKIDAATGKLSTAIKQLDYTEQLLSDQLRRNGFEAVVSLMQTTATTAAAICTRITNLAPALGAPPTTDQQTLIDTLTRVLDSLARLSPAAVWENRPQKTSGA